MSTIRRSRRRSTTSSSSARAEGTFERGDLSPRPVKQSLPGAPGYRTRGSLPSPRQAKLVGAPLPGRARCARGARSGISTRVSTVGSVRGCLDLRAHFAGGRRPLTCAWRALYSGPSRITVSSSERGSSRSAAHGTHAQPTGRMESAMQVPSTMANRSLVRTRSRRVAAFVVAVAATAVVIPLGARHAVADEPCQSPYMARIVGQEDFVYVWTLGDPKLGVNSDSLVTIDVKPGSPSYGKVDRSRRGRLDQRGAPRRAHRRPRAPLGRWPRHLADLHLRHRERRREAEARADHRRRDQGHRRAGRPAHVHRAPRSHADRISFQLRRLGQDRHGGVHQRRPASSARSGCRRMRHTATTRARARS